MPPLEERNREMYRRYTEDGWTLLDVADEFGLSKGYVWRIFRDNDWPMRPPGPPPGTPWHGNPGVRR